MDRVRIQIFELTGLVCWALLDEEGRAVCEGTPRSSVAEVLAAIERARARSTHDDAYRRTPCRCDLVDADGTLLATFESPGGREREVDMLVTRRRLRSAPVEQLAALR